MKARDENPSHIVVIGTGVGGLTVAAVLARGGLDVTVLESHVYPGGCAGTFYHQGYRFDVGVTLASGFYPGGPMELVAQATGIQDSTAHPAAQAMEFLFPDNSRVALCGNESRWHTRAAVFGESSIPFWSWQERTADALWKLALQLPTWPPQSIAQGVNIIEDGLTSRGADFRKQLSPTFLAVAYRSISSHLTNSSERGIAFSLANRQQQSP